MDMIPVSSVQGKNIILKVKRRNQTMEIQQLNNTSGSASNKLFNADVRVVFPKDKNEMLYAFIDLGWAITPNYGIYKNYCNCYDGRKCKDPGKHPRSKLNPLTRKYEVLSTREKAQIDEWLEKREGNFIQYSNWAVKCGKENGIIAFDIDPRHGGKRETFEFPPTLEYQTQGGGWRLLYKYPDFEIEGNPNFGEGIELLVNSYITLPPSVGKYGSYQWLNDLPIAEISSEFIELGNKKNPGEGYRLPDEIEEGERDINAFKYACSLRAQGLEKSEILSSLMAINGVRINPPLDETQIITKVDQACKYPKGKDKFGIYKDPIENIHRWSVAELLDTNFPDPKWSIPDLIPEGEILLGGRPKTGKSWLILYASIAVSTGGIFLGKKVELGNVLYISFEDNARRLKERITKLSIPRNANITFTNEWQPLHEKGFDDLLTEIESHDYRMIVFDTLSRAFPGLSQGKDPEKISKILGNLQSIAINKPLSLVFIDHTRKLGNGFPDPIEDILSTTGKTAVADAVFGLYTNQGKKGASLIGRGKDIPEINLDLFFDPITGCWQENNQLQETKDEIIEALKIIGKSKVSEVAKYIQKDRSNTGKRLRSLASEGKIQDELIGDVTYYFLDEESPF
jgi:hypothetical protein